MGLDGTCCGKMGFFGEGFLEEEFLKGTCKSSEEACEFLVCGLLEETCESLEGKFPGEFSGASSIGE